MMAIPGFAGTTINTGSSSAGQAVDQTGAPADEFAALFAASITNDVETSTDLPEVQKLTAVAGPQCDFMGELPTDSGSLQPVIAKSLPVLTGEALQAFPTGQTISVSVAGPAVATGPNEVSKESAAETVSKDKDKEAVGKTSVTPQMLTASYLPPPAPVSATTVITSVVSEVKSEELPVPVRSVTGVTPEPGAYRNETAIEAAPAPEANPQAVSAFNPPSALPAEPALALPVEPALDLQAAPSVARPDGAGDRVREVFAYRSKVADPVLPRPVGNFRVNQAGSGNKPVEGQAGIESTSPITNSVGDSWQPETNDPTIRSMQSSGPDNNPEPSELTGRDTPQQSPAVVEAPSAETAVTVESSVRRVQTVTPQLSDAKPVVLPSGITVTSIEVEDNSGLDKRLPDISSPVITRQPASEAGYQRISDAIRSLRASSFSNGDDNQLMFPENAGDGKRLPATSANGDSIVADPVSASGETKPTRVPAIPVFTHSGQSAISTAPVPVSVPGNSKLARGGSSRVTEEADAAVPDRINAEPAVATVSGTESDPGRRVVEPAVLTSSDRGFRFRKDPLSWSNKTGSETETRESKAPSIPSSKSAEPSAGKAGKPASAVRNSPVAERAAVKPVESDTAEVRTKSDDAGSFVSSLTTANGTVQAVKDSAGKEIQPPVAQVAAKIIETTTALHRGETRSIKLSLSPEKLGRVEVEVRRDNDGRVTAILTADRTEAARAISDGLPGLRQHLEQNGVPVANLDVQTTGGQMQGNLTNNSNNPHNPQQEVIRNPELSGAGPLGTEGQDPTKEDRLLNVLA